MPLNLRCSCKLVEQEIVEQNFKLVIGTFGWSCRGQTTMQMHMRCRSINVSENKKRNRLEERMNLRLFAQLFMKECQIGNLIYYVNDLFLLREWHWALGF